MAAASRMRVRATLNSGFCTFASSRAVVRSIGWASTARIVGGRDGRRGDRVGGSSLLPAQPGRASSVDRSAGFGRASVRLLCQHGRLRQPEARNDRSIPHSAGTA